MQENIPNNSPALTVILATPGPEVVVARTLRALTAQTAREQMELLVVALHELNLEIPDVFCSVRILNIGPFETLSVAKTKAVAKVTAPLVVFVEDHCFPEPNWAEALIRLGEGSWGAMGPFVKNANPDTAVSRVNFLMTYARWSNPDKTGEIEQTPWHNSCYQTKLLHEFGDGLADYLAVEGILQNELRAKGYRHYLTADTTIHHINYSKISALLMHAYLGGRLFASLRAEKESWPVFKRMFYSFMAPLIPVVRFYRIVKDWPMPGERWTDRIGLSPLLLLALVFHALGETAGNLFGQKNTEKHYMNYEINRSRFVIDCEKPLLF